MKSTSSFARSNQFICVAMLAASLGLLPLACRTRSTVGSAAKPSAATLTESFPADIAKSVYVWDAADPRPAAERQRALAKFAYEGYQSSAWVPQSAFDGNWFLQTVVGDADSIVRNRIGMVLWPENKVARAYGMAPNPDPTKPLSWTMNCVACHVAEIDGVAYFGAGGKVLDEKMLGETVEQITNLGARRLLGQNPADNELAARANDILKRHHHEKFDSLTRGRSTAFAASHVEMHMRTHEGRMPASADVGRGDVKVPPLWHTVAKLPFRRWYSDGSFHGEFPLMASSMELALDRSFEGLSTHVVPIIKQDFEQVIQFLRPPRYPHSVDAELAARGKTLFYSKQMGCSQCHGTYDGRGNVEWTGLHVDVGTDPARLELVTRSFVAAFDQSPLAAEGKLIKSRGYAATPLTGVWANYPYLHNGSVPTLHHLLGPESERPKIFSVFGARDFDRERVGQRLLADRKTRKYDEAALRRQHGNDRSWFNADWLGSDNRGHDFWSRIQTDENRKALIEYLKTL